MSVLNLKKWITDKKEFWAWQIIENIFSLSLRIPLRLYNKQNADKVWEEKFTDFKNKIESVADNREKFFDEIRLIEIPSLRPRYEFWHTSPSYELPFVHQLRQNEKWRIWEEVYFYHHLMGKNKKLEGSYIKENKDEMHASPDLYWKAESISIDDFNAFLVGGPCWTSKEFTRGEQLFEYININLLEKIEKKFSPEHYELLKKTAKESISLSPEHFKSQLEKAKQGFELLLSIEIDSKIKYIRRCDYADLAFFIIFLIKHEKNIPNIITETINKKKEKKSIFKLSLTKQTSELPIPEIKVSVPFTASESKTRYSLTASYDNNSYLPAKIYLSSEQINSVLCFYVNRNKDAEASDKFLKIARNFYYEVQAKRRGYGKELLFSLRNWVYQEFGTISALSLTPKEIESKEIETGNYNHLMKEIALLVNADIVNYYQYNHADDVLDIQAIACFHPDSKKEEEFEKANRNLMDNQIKNNCKLKEKSISYRSIKKNTPLFCRRYDPETNISDPEGETILTNENFPFRSVISVPLTINRHPWGVIEIAGLSPNQFRWENQNLLSDLVEIISPILYQHLVLKSLQELNHNIFHHTTPLENYNKICDIISRIFFAGAATLWLPDMEKPEIYKCVGAFNRPDITKKLHEAIDLLTFLSKDTSDSLAASSLTVDKPFLYELINKKKHLKNHQKELPGMGFKGRLAYPLRNFEKKVLGVFSLYYKHDISFGDVWHPTFRFISQFLSLLFEAMQAEQDWERSIRQTIAHEVKQKVDAIFDSVESLKYKIKRGELTSGTMDLILDDLQANKKELRETMLILGKVSLREFRNVEHPVLSLAALQKEKGQIMELSLRRFFNRCFRTTFQLRREKKMKDEYIGPLKGPYILCNSNRLKDILDNLVTNAVKYATHGSTIKAVVEKEEYVIKLSLSNRSPSLEPEEKRRIFIRGFRSKYAKKQKIEGKGEGLWLTRKLCEIYNIELSYRDKPVPEGNCIHTFTLFFPKTMVVSHSNVR